MVEAIYGSRIEAITATRILLDGNLSRDLDLIKLKTENDEKQYLAEWDQKNNRRLADDMDGNEPVLL